MVEFATGDLYEFEGIPGMPEPEAGAPSDLGEILKVESISVDGRVAVLRGRRISGRPPSAATFADRMEVPISDAAVMIDSGIWRSLS